MCKGGNSTFYTPVIKNDSKTKTLTKQKTNFYFVSSEISIEDLRLHRKSKSVIFVSIEMKQPWTDQACSNVGGPSEQLIN